MGVPDAGLPRPARPARAGAEGAALAGEVRAHLLAAALPCGAIAPRPEGWGFEAEGPEGRYRIDVALDPWDEGEAREAARLMLGRARVAKRRSLPERLMGRNRPDRGEAVPAAVRAFLAAHPALRPLEGP